MKQRTVLTFLLGYVCASLCGLHNAYATQPELIEAASIQKAKPVAPNVSQYNRAFVEQALQPLTRKGRASIQRLSQHRQLLATIFSLNFAEFAKRQTQVPQGIFIDDGILDLAQLAAAVPDVLIKNSATTYTARLPIIVMPEATLLLKDGETLRLSESDGAYIFSTGKLFMLGAELLGWRREQAGVATYSGIPERFRPYVLNYSGSQTYIVNSRLAHLGHQGRASFGLSFKGSSPTARAFATGALAEHLARSPEVWVLDSEFHNLYFGFYCADIEHGILRGNTYSDSIVYGIDPHDYSRHLVIAENTVHGTRKKHGIILSREVTDSWVVGNRTYNNKRSGIMMDRSSSHNTIAYNETFKNGGDGITLYESADVLVYGNRVYGNREHGVRVRNSPNSTIQDNVILGNLGSGVYFHTRSLADHTHRNFELDPYEQRVSGALLGGLIAGNRGGAAYSENTERLDIGHLLVTENGAGGESVQFRGALQPLDHTLKYALWPKEKALRLQAVSNNER